MSHRLGVVFLSLASATVAQAQMAGPEFHVNTFTTDTQYHPSVASDGSGNFVVVWSSRGGQDGDNAGIFGRRFNSAGVPLGPEFGVNTYTTDLQGSPSVASDRNGILASTMPRERRRMIAQRPMRAARARCWPRRCAGRKVGAGSLAITSPRPGGRRAA